jgi:hypothetical protein
MTNRSFRSDAGPEAERRGLRSRESHLRAFGQALTGIALGFMSVCALAATDLPTVPTRLTAAPPPLSISPARIKLSGRTPTVVVTVHNENQSMAMVVQLQPMIWTEGGIAPHYELTSDVIATPATITVAPGATKAVQVALQSAATVPHGQDFQLFWQARAQRQAATYDSDDQQGGT